MKLSRKIKQIVTGQRNPWCAPSICMMHFTCEGCERARHPEFRGLCCGQEVDENYKCRVCGTDTKGD